MRHEDTLFHHPRHKGNPGFIAGGGELPRVQEVCFSLKPVNLKKRFQTAKSRSATAVIPVRPDATHEYVLETALVAKGYGVAENVIRNHKDRNRAELIEGKHFVSSATKCDAGNLQRVTTLWTKRGITVANCNGGALLQRVTVA